jgi:hypothetical protein
MVLETRASPANGSLVFMHLIHVCYFPLINYDLGHITTGALHPWQYMYLFAGSWTLCWGVLIYFILPPNPIRAKGFSDRERYIAVARMRENNTGVRNTHFK